MKIFTKLFSIAIFLLCFINIISFNINKDGIAIRQNMLFAQGNNSVWVDVPEVNYNTDPGKIMPLKYRNLNLNLKSFQSILSSAPFEFSERALNLPLIIELPMPNGNLSKFYVTEYSIMEPGLANQFPEIKTYNIKGIDDPYAVGKIDVTMSGFHGMVLTPNGDYFIDPLSMDNTENYISYFKSDYLSNQPIECKTVLPLSVMYEPVLLSLLL